MNITREINYLLRTQTIRHLLTGVGSARPVPARCQGDSCVAHLPLTTSMPQLSTCRPVLLCPSGLFFTDQTRESFPGHSSHLAQKSQALTTCQGSHLHTQGTLGPLSRLSPTPFPTFFSSQYASPSNTMFHCLSPTRRK